MVTRSSLAGKNLIKLGMIRSTKIVVHLGLPAEGDIPPVLEAQGAVSDPDFQVIISFRKNTQAISHPNRRGAVSLRPPAG